MAEPNPLDEYAAAASEALKTDSVQIKNTSVDRVEGGQVSLTNSAVQRVNTQALYMENAAAALVHTHTVEGPTASAIGAVVVDNLNAEQIDARALVARNVNAEQVNAGLLLALRVDGDVHARWTPLTALAAGSAFAATLVILPRLLRLLRGNGK
jgi:hypothetical protein